MSRARHAFAVSRLKELGCTIDTIRRGKHITIKFTRADGEKRQLTVSYSPSDTHARANTLRDIRKLCESPSETQEPAR